MQHRIRLAVIDAPEKGQPYGQRSKQHFTQALPPLIEPQLTGMSPQSLGLEGYKEVKTPEGIAFYRQRWCCRMR